MNGNMVSLFWRSYVGVGGDNSLFSSGKLGDCEDATAWIRKGMSSDKSCCRDDNASETVVRCEAVFISNFEIVGLFEKGNKI
jgi:hypothetical protein